ncbi:MAG: sugar phosphate isomerase/epimerase [Candidatus Acidiferrales bacterium]|jgi:sugar phosphate isomerase/epimerase
MKSQVELVTAYWTIAGAFPGDEQEYSPFDFKDRVEAAARAGFKGLGIWHADLDHILERRTLKEMKQILDDSGMEYVEVEFLTDWFLDGKRKRQSDIRKRKLLAAAEALQAKQVKVGDFFHEKCPMPRLIDSFAKLCADAAEHGTRVAFEPMGAAMIHTLEESLEMVEGAGAKNGGIVLDLWHVVNLGISYDAVSRVPLRYLFGVEVNDAVKAKIGTLPPEVIEPRTFCGEGDFDIRGFIGSVKKTGYAGPWGIEVFAKELLQKPLEELTTRAFKTTIAQFVS